MGRAVESAKTSWPSNVHIDLTMLKAAFPKETMRRAILTLIFLTTATGSFAAEMTEADLALLRDSWSNRKQTINEVSKYIESLKNVDLDSLAVMQLKKRIRELRAQANETIR